MGIRIIGTGKAVPQRRVSNDELAQQIETNDEWIRSHTGIGARHIAGEGVSSGDLAAEAARQALALAFPGKGLEEAALLLDLILVATATPDFYGTPSTACLVQGNLGARGAAAMDITAGCTGFIYALETAAGLLSRGERRYALVIGAETLTKVTDWTDRGSCVLFGDGAGAVVLEAEPDGAAGGLLRTILASDGSGWEHLIIRRGGSRHPLQKGETLDKAPHIEMNGRAVYNFAVKAVTDIIEDLLKVSGLQPDDIDLFVPHQANARIIQAAAKRLGIPESMFYINMEEYANTSSASIPIALDELNRRGELKQGDLIMTVGFGAGLSYGGNLIVW